MQHRMRLQRHSSGRAEINRGLYLFLVFAGLGIVTGCGHKEEPATAPAEIKAAMGGHYSPEVMAQGRAAQASDAQRNAQMLQSKGVDPPALKKTTVSNP